MGKIFEFTAKLLTERKHSKIWHRISTLIACLVVFTTTYSMILPALTFDEVTASEEPGFDMGAAENEQEAVPVEDVSQNEYYEEEPIQNDSNYTEDYPASTGSADSGELIVEEEPAAVPAADTTNVYDNTVPAEEAGFAPEGNGEVVDFSDTEEPETVLAYEDAEVRLTASFEDPTYEIPAGLTLKVAPIAYGSEQYNALNDGANERLTEIGNYVISYSAYYDIWFELNGETVIPALNVKLEAQYKNRDLGETGVKLFSYNYDGNAITLHDDVTWGVYDDSDPTWPWRSSFTFRTHGGDVTGHTIAGMLNTEVVEKETAEDEAEVSEEEATVPEENAEPETTIEETATEETVPEETPLTEEAVIEGDEFLEEDEYELANEDIIPVEETEDELTEAAAVGDAAADDEAAAEETSEEADSEEASLYKVGQIVYNGSDYTVELNVPEEAHIPSDAELKVDEIDPESDAYKEYYDQAMAAINEEGRELEAGFARFFDIRFEKDGVEIEPNPLARIDVKINFAQTVDQQTETENAQTGEVSAVHFAENGVEEVNVETETQGEAADVAEISFEASSFSVFGFVYTVDFETMDGGTYSILGGYEYSLTDILSIIGIDLTDSEIVAADFSNTSVLYCYLNEDGRWRLNSVGPFTTQETLTIKTIDNRIIRIKVSDAAIDYDGVTYANIADLSNSIGVTVNGTNLNNEQARNKTFSLTFNFSMLYDNAAAARSDTYFANGTYNWCYDLSQMAAEYPEIAEFPNMTGTLRQGTTPLGTYEVVGNRVYLHVRPEALSEDASQQISGKFSLDMQLDETGTGSKESTTFNFPGGGTFTVKYKPVEYENGTKSANPTSAVVYPSDTPDGYYYVDYTANISERVELTSLVFNDILGPGQELVTSSVKVNGVGTSVSPTGNADEGQAFSLNVINALGVSSIPANTPVQITYRARVPKEKIDAAGSAGLPLSNNANWDIGNVDVPGGETTVNLQKGDYNGPTKSIVNSSSYANNSSDKVVDPNSNDKIGNAIKAKEAWQNTDGTYHISYKVSFNEPAVPSTIGMSDTYGNEQSLLTDSFTVTYNGQKYTIPSSYISNEGGSFRIDNLKGAIEEATGAPFAKDTNYDINYETQVTAANFNKPITNTSTLILDKDYPSNETQIELTSEEFQPGTKKNTSGKNINITNTDNTTTSWEISITEPKKANQKAELTDTFDSSRMTVNTGSFKVKIAYNEEYDIPASFVNVSGDQFKIDLNGVLAYLKANKGYTGEAYVEGGKNYAITYTTTTNTAAVTEDIKNSANNQKTLENTANWVFKDDNPESPQPGGKDDVTYTIPEYKDTTKTDTVTGNVNKLYSSQNGATYEVTGAGPYTINYTITVPAQDMDLTKVQLNDTYSTNQTLNTGSFVLTVGGETVTIPDGALNAGTPGQFTLDVLQAMNISKLEKGKEIKLTYSATTTAIGEDITNKSVWSFNSVAGEHTDEKETKEKLDKPEYKPGNKYVRNENANVELTDLTHDDKYRFDWTLTITEPGELTKAILKDDYGTDSKPHTMMISSEHPMTITAGDRTITFESVEAFAASEAVNYDANTGKFSIDMLKLFNVQKFPAGTTFTAEYSTETTGDTVPDSGTYHNEATWNFDGIGGPKDDVPGGEADTTLTPKEFNDGTKSSFYNGQRLTGGKFREDGSTIIDYVATIGQDSGVTLLNFTDDWGDSRVDLVYPIRVKDSSGTVIHTFTSPEDGWLSVTDTGFVVQVVKDGKLQNGSDFVEGTTYSVEYSLDFAGTANEEGDFDGVVIRNRGHWHTEGDLPPHDDYPETPDEPQSPPWEPIDKAVTNVKYTNSHAGLAPETPLDHTEGSDTWWTDQYTKGDEANPDDNGTFYINYEVTMSQPRDLTGLELADVTNIPYGNGNFSAIRNDATMPNKLTIYDADGNIATWGQLLGNDDTHQAVFDNFDIVSGSYGGNLSYNFLVIEYLKSAMGATKVTIPKDFTTKLEFQIALWSNMDDEGYPRVNTDPNKWHNKITAKFNGKHEETDEVDTLIKTRLALDKVFYEVGDTDTLKENGARLEPGSRVKYEITVGHDGDIIPEGGYKITDTMTNVYVQNFDTEAGITVTDKNGGTVEGTLSTHTMDVADRHYVDGFEYTIPAGTVCPVTIVYYVDNTTQEEANTMNEDSNSMNDLFGEQTVNNTVRSPEEKEVTTEYLVNYTTGHTVDKQLSRWDGTSGTAYWTVQVTANPSQNPAFKAGYKVKEDLYKYTQTAPAGATWTQAEINSASSMELDLSSVIVMNNGTRLTLGSDYKIEGDSIVLLKEQNAGNLLKITNIRTRIPGWQEGVTPKTYYYNDASYRTPTDSLLDEDDDNNDTDLVAHLKKKFAEYDPETGNVTWTITITPRKGESLKNYHLSDDFNNMYQWGNVTRFANLVSYNAVLLNSNTPLVENVDFTYSQSNTSVFDIKSDISEPVRFTVEYKIAYNPEDLLNAEEIKVYNKVLGNFPNEEPEVSEDEKEFRNEKLTIDKTVSSSDTGEPLQVGEESYPTLKDLGDNTYEYTVRINTDKRNIAGEITLTDYLPDGFELVDYNGQSQAGIGGYTCGNIPYYDTDLDVKYYGGFEKPPTDPGFAGDATEQNSALLQPVLIRDNDNKVIGFSLGNLFTQGWNSGLQITVKYKVKLTDEKKAELSTLKTGAIQYFENTATARTETRSGTATETVVYQYTEALKKEDVTDETSAHNGGLISYEILVNAEGEAPNYTHRDLNSGNPLTLTDNIPTSIELDRESVKVYKWTGSAWAEMPIAANEEQIANGTGYSASYHGDTRELILRVADNTSFKVTFDGWAEKTTRDTDGDGELDDEQGEHFINTATLTGEGQFVAKTDEQHKVYTAEGGVGDVPYDGFAIEKFDENNLTKKLNGAEFTLYKVKEYNAIPESYLIPDTNEWVELSKKTTTSGVAKFSGLSYAQPIGTGEAGNGWEETYSSMQVVLYAWVESGLSQELIEEGYQIGDNAAPHFFILYHKASSATDPVEVKKEASSYALADLFDGNLQTANFITVNKAKTAYTWPVQNAGKTSKTVTKLWDDKNNKKGLRPKANEVHVQLMQNNQPYGAEVTLIDATIDKNNPKYTYTWFDLPLTDPETKEPYTYTVQETQIDENYIATYSGDTFTITNHLVDNTTFIANKVWEDEDNVERKRPQSITYTLYQEDESGNLRVYDTQTVGNDKNFSYKWEDLPTVDDPDDPTTTYRYFVQETKMTAFDGTEYVLDERTGKLVHDGTALYVTSAEAVEGAENVYKITNTVVSSRTGSVKLTKTLTGLTGNHSNIDAGEGKKADEKTYSVTLTDSDGYKIYAVLDTEKSTDELKVYNFDHIQTTVNDFTTFEISEKVSVQVNNLPLGAYSYTATENTSGDMIIPGYQFDASASGGSVTAVQVKPENDPDNENPVEANLINNYIPDKGTLSLTKEVRGLPTDVDLTKYRFPVTVSTESTDENGDPVTLYVNAQGKLVDAPMVLYIVPGTPLVIENVPIGSYDVNELYEDENRMPVLAYTGMDEELAASIAHYSLDTDSSTLQLTGLAVTKNNTRTGKLINSYSPKGSLILDKTVTVEGVTYDAAKLAELEAGDEAAQALAAQIKGITFKVTNFGTKEVVADNITYADILAAKAESGSYKIDNLPYGTYVVTESNTTVGDYTLTTTWTVDDETKASGQILLGDDNVDGAKVEITNEYEVSTADLTVTKKIDKANSSTKDVSFYVGLFTDANGTTPVSEDIVGANPKEVKFNANSTDTQKSVTFAGLTIGTKYYVFETKSDGTKVAATDSVGGYAIVAGDVDGKEITIAAGDNTVTITNEYDATGKTTFEGTKTLKNRKFKEGDTLTVSISSSDGGKLPTDASGKSVTLTKDGTANTANFSFAEVTYTYDDIKGSTATPKSKTFHYTVTENATMSGTTKDTKTHTIEVTVTDKGDGTLTITKVYKADSTVETKTDFENTYNATTTLVPKAQKVFTNGTISQNQFKFILTEVDNANATDAKTGTTPDEITVSSTVAVNFKTISYKLSDLGGQTSKTFYYTIKEDIPADATEDNGYISGGIKYDPKVYRLEVTVSDDGSGTLQKEIKLDGNVVTEANLIAVFTNEQLGNLKIKKNIWVNGQPVTAGAKSLADGTYTFTVKSTTLATLVSREVTIKFENGEITEAKIDGVDATVTDGVVLVPKLPADTYEVKEEATVNGTSLISGIDNPQSIVVLGGDTAGIKTAEFTNNIDTGDLELTKTVSGKTDTTTEFEFEITLTAPTNVTLESTYSGTIAGVAATFTVGNDGKVKVNGENVKLKHNEKMVIADLPSGTDYVIEEKNVPTGFTPNGSNLTGKIPANNAGAKATASASVTNVFAAENTTTFNVKKTFTNGDLSKKSFKFTLSQVDAENSDGTPSDVKLATPVEVTTASETGTEQTLNFTLPDTFKFTQDDIGKTFWFMIEEDVPTEAKESPFISNQVKYANPFRKWVSVTVSESAGQLQVTKSTPAGQPDASFVNEQLGKLVVTKTFDGGAAADLTDDQKKAVKFSIDGPDGFTDITERPLSHESFVESEGVYTLTLDNIPLGEYKVTESNTAIGNYQFSSKVSVDGEETANVTTGTTTLTSTKLESTVAVTNTYEKYQLEVSKTFDAPTGMTAAQKNAVTISVTGEGLTGTLTHTYEEISAMEDGKWILTTADNNIQPGKEYTVTETNAEIDGYTLTTTYKVNGEEAGNTNKVTLEEAQYTGASVEVINKYEPTKLTISKAVTPAGTSTEEFTFKVTVEKDSTKYTGKAYTDAAMSQEIQFNENGEYSATVAAGSSLTIYGLPVGYTYKVTEDGKTGFVLVSVDGDTAKTESTGTISSTESTAAFINKEVTEAHALKVWSGDDDDKTHRPANITYTLTATYKDGAQATQPLTAEDLGITSLTIDAEPGADADYKADWPVLPKYTAEGKLISYSIDETLDAETAKYYTKSVVETNSANHTWTATNTFGSTGITLTGEKKMETGETPGTYSFTLSAAEGIPMPAGAVVAEGKSTVTVENQGAAITLGTINYTLDDWKNKGTAVEGDKTKKTFTYTVKEVQGDQAGIIYDATEYTVVVTVVNTDGTLTVEKDLAITKADSTPADKIEFTNKELVDIDATKTWKNGETDVTDKITKASVTFTLESRTKTGEETWSEWATATVTAAKNGNDAEVTLKTEGTASADKSKWKASWKDLPKYDEGKLIEYRVTESAAKVDTEDAVMPDEKSVVAETYGTVDGHTNPTAVVGLTNELPKKTVEGTKVWEIVSDTLPAEDPVLTLTRTSKKPESVTETLKNPEKAEENLQPTWENGADGKSRKFTYTDLPKYDDYGYLYDYAVTEASFKIGEVTYTVTKDGENYIATPDNTSANPFVVAQAVSEEKTTITNTEKKEFEFTKEWHDEKSNVVEWETGTSIKVNVKRKISGNDEATEDIKTYTIKKTATGFDITPASELTIVKNSDKVYTFKLADLEAKGEIEVEQETVKGEFIYYATEDKPDGYREPSYSNPSGSGSGSVASDDYVLHKGKIINTPFDAIELPNTGGHGTLPFKVSGSILLAFSALMYVTSFRRRQQEALARTGGYFEGDAEREAMRGGGSRR